MEESDDLVSRLGFCGGSCLEGDAREERGSYTFVEATTCGGRPGYARVCPLYSLYLSVFGIVLLRTVVSALMKLI